MELNSSPEPCRVAFLGEQIHGAGIKLAAWQVGSRCIMPTRVTLFSGQESAWEQTQSSFKPQRNDGNRQVCLCGTLPSTVTFISGKNELQDDVGKILTRRGIWGFQFQIACFVSLHQRKQLRERPLEAQSFQVLGKISAQVNSLLSKPRVIMVAGLQVIISI